MNSLKPLPIEEALIRTFLGPSTEPLNIAVHRRKFTGVGLYTDFSASAPVRSLPPGEGTPLEGPFVESPRIENGAGSLLWPKSNGIHTLEIFTYTDPFPEDLTEFELRS